MSMSSRLAAVTKGNVALLGDASGTVDAVTGEGLHLAFRQAEALAKALDAGNLSYYGTAHARLIRQPQLISRLLLLMDGNKRLRRLAFRSLAALPQAFSGMLAFHAGAHPPRNFRLDPAGGMLGMLSWPQAKDQHPDLN
jgi:menaquinone-9 beta-reductase